MTAKATRSKCWFQLGLLKIDPFVITCLLKTPSRNLNGIQIHGPPIGTGQKNNLRESYRGKAPRCSTEQLCSSRETSSYRLEHPTDARTCRTPSTRLSTTEKIWAPPSPMFAIESHGRRFETARRFLDQRNCLAIESNTHPLPHTR